MSATTRHPLRNGRASTSREQERRGTEARMRSLLQRYGRMSLPQVGRLTPSAGLRTETCSTWLTPWTAVAGAACGR
jgi:hypothetical protein